MNQIEQIVKETLAEKLPEDSHLLPDTQVFADLDSITIAECFLTVEDKLARHFDWYKVTRQTTLQELIVLISEGRA